MTSMPLSLAIYAGLTRWAQMEHTQDKEPSEGALAKRDEVETTTLTTIEMEQLDTLFRHPEEEFDTWLETSGPEEVRALVLHAREVIRNQDAKFARMLDIGSALGDAFHIDDLLKIIVEKTTELMDAERSTLFLIDDETNELWSKIVQGSVNIEIRLQLGQGIAGWVALTGKSLNIRDAYRDPRFNPKVDESTGYLTRNILCQPIRNLQGDIIGVIQVLNRRHGNFSDEDEYLLSAIASQAAVAIENSKLYLSAIEQNMELIEIKDKLEHKVGELDMLYELERLLSRASTLERLVEGAFEKTLDLVHASVGALVLIHDGQQHAYVLYDEGDWQTEWVFRDYPIERADTLGAEAIKRGEAVMTTVDDPEFKGAMARAAATWGVAIENGLALPLVVDEEYIGSVEVLNTIDLNEDGEVGFTEDDRKILSVVASQLAAEIVARRRREEEEKNERLASIGQMLSGVLHDFKNPMAIISGYVQLMSRAEDSDKRGQFAGNILRQLDQLNQMTRELLAFARGERNLLLRKTFIHKFIEEVSELLTPELETRAVDLALELDYRNDVKIDQVKMKRAILNLARNAADAIGPGGGTFKIRVWLDEAHDEVVFVFTDDGPGIPEDIRDTLFESFVTHGKVDGTGLGLAIVKRIVEDHGGSVDFVTDMGVGTSFIVRIPRNPASEESGA